MSRAEKDANRSVIIDVPEWAVALEILCEQIYEYDLVVPADAIAIIASIGREESVEERYWSILATE